MMETQQRIPSLSTSETTSQLTLNICVKSISHRKLFLILVLRKLQVLMDYPQSYLELAVMM